ncbi:MAG TPA: FimV/HubP family polar landmark protein [Woeseiaceae bacterium]
MSRSFTRISLVLALLLTSEVWAVGLGDIRLDSALNEPLRAEIELLSATPEELTNLKVALASAETFTRYGIDRPFFLQGIEFNVVTSGPNGAVVQLRSRSPIAEPFLTFLVEATWASGRLLREYTVLLDPPTYSPPAVQQAPVVEAPRRAAPADSAAIERQPEPVYEAPAPEAPAPTRAAPPRSQPEPIGPAPVVDETPKPRPAPVADDAPYGSTPGGDYIVQRNETLWRIATRMRPDSRLTMNQTMLAIFEANPQAFGGNINVLRAGAALRIPSADRVFQINRGDALLEVQRQHAAWGGGAGYTAPAAVKRPSLTLVPPDEEPTGSVYDDMATEEPMSREAEIEARIAELEAADVPNQQSLIEIRDNELAQLRQELANIRGEVYEPPVAEVQEPEEMPADDVMADIEAEVEEEAAGDDAGEEETSEPVAEEPEVAQPVVPSNVVRTDTRKKTGILDTVMDALSSIWTGIISALLVVAGLLLWFVRRGREDVDDSGPWDQLDGDELAPGSLASTESLRAPVVEDDAFVVVEERGSRRRDSDTVSTPALDDDTGTGEFDALADTFSSETAVNLDQTDPVAEADFHMAYGLYDQAADLITGALESDPGDQSLMAKLCEIYFVWGNRDAFIDAAGNLKDAVGNADSDDWNKIVIMGQQIAADDPLFAGAAVAGSTREVDLSFDSDSDAGGELDMDFGSDDAGASDVIDLGAADDDGLDFFLDDASTGENRAVDLGGEPTVEMPSVEKTQESPTIEQQLGATSELPALDEMVGKARAGMGYDAEETAEINLDELGLDIDDLESTGTNEMLEITGSNYALDDDGEATGKNLEIDIDATGRRQALDIDDTGIGEGLDFDDLDSTGMRLAPDETGRMPMLDVERETDASIDADLLDATGHTQVLSEDFLADDEATMLGGDDEEDALPDDAETLLASLDDDDEEDDFDFAKTEALPANAFTGNSNLDETNEMPAVAETDLDLDLEDLTAALRRTDGGDTAEYPRDDATVEQPRPSLDDTTEAQTLSISPDDMSDDLQDARTMTEVGTKLDLARAYVDMGDPAGARSILEEVLDEGDASQRQQAQKLLDSLPG